MDGRFGAVSGLAAEQHGVVGTAQLERCGVDRRTRSRWMTCGLLVPAGPRSFVLAGAPATWWRDLWSASMDIGGRGFIAGRSAAGLLGLDGFRADAVEVLVGRAHRNVKAPHIVRSTSQPLTRLDTLTVEGVRCLTAERLILESPLFSFSGTEIGNVIDSAIRRRLVHEGRLRDRVVEAHARRAGPGSRALVDALVDSGGESWLERRFLTLLRRAGLPRPQLQRIWRDGNRMVARVDVYFPSGLVVELAGHASHSSRQERQRDEQRRTELTLRGKKVIVFTYEDIRDRPDWAVAQTRIALGLAA